MNSVLFLSYDGLTDPLGQSQILPYIIGLTDEGYHFTIISFEKKDRYQKHGQFIHELCVRHGIDWEVMMYTKHPPVLSTLKDIYALKNKALKLVRAKKISLVHCRSYITALAGLWLKKRTGVKMIFDMRGFWADERIDGAIWNLKNPVHAAIYRYFKRKETDFLLNADHTIVLTYDAEHEIKTWKSFSNGNVEITVIPCCVDLELFDPKSVGTQVGQLKAEMGVEPGQNILSYIGSIGTWYLLEEMLDFFKFYLKQFPGSIFLFVTKESPDIILAAAQKKNIDKRSLRIIESAREDVPSYIAISTHSIFFIKPSYSKKASSPTKQGEIMAMGIPLICNDKVGDSSFVVDKYNSGCVVLEFEKSQYNRSLQRLVAADFDPTTIRQGAEEFYSLEKGVQRYKQVYKSLIK